jgi:hypothetical protein
VKRKRFFFEKKRTKKLLYFGVHANGKKVFASFFKKKRFLSLPGAMSVTCPAPIR